MSWQRVRRLPPGTLGLAGAALVIAIGAAASALDGATDAGRVSGPRPCNDTAATPVPQPGPAQMAAAGLDRLPVAPQSQRADLVAPAFSNSTTITNPLFPISRLQSVVLNGRVGGKAFRTETTLLPDTQVVEWADGQCIKVLLSQYTAYIGGRIDEVAIDRYAQADDGSVWYLGEDVFNYKDGAVADTAGTWLAGKEGPAAMIMPAAPKPGLVSRPENIPGVVFEEVAIAATDQTFQGPRGPVAGGIVGRELHDDGTYSDKQFAPGYGEFRSASNGELEALAVAIPTDAVPGPPPAELQRIASGVDGVLRALRSPSWPRAQRTVTEIKTAWRSQLAAGVPPRLGPPMTAALRTLSRALAARSLPAARQAALDVLQANLDVELRYRSQAEVDRARFDLWLRRLFLDAAASDWASASGDVATLEWIRDRFARSLESARAARVDDLLKDLRGFANDEEFRPTVRTAIALRGAPAR